MLDVFYENIQILSIVNPAKANFIKEQCSKIMKLDEDQFYLVSNGRLVSNESILENALIYAVLRQCGGKGGFGSMLRAIGAQIEKTTNREACRDLSGRRLRDINEEKRLKTWITQQVDRETEAAEKKKKKLEKLCEKPRHEFKDEAYDMERSVLPEKVEDAVLQGLEAANKGMSGKRKQNNDRTVKKKKPKLWFDAEEEISDSDGSDSDANEQGASSTVVVKNIEVSEVKST
ncbi:hypothetical protein FQA39_LY08044 [Lamprigera yunnana]|nr:hypothetical protein FQA39_LY08044 [Lamprigera yunnana]